MAHPDNHDVIVRPQIGHSVPAYLLGTFSGPDQFIIPTFAEAVSQACAYAKHQGVRAWVLKDDGDFLPLETFRAEQVESAEST